ncbi:MAG: amidohydrolase family protein [Candidatus Eremiobacteraeota bacterium]|nr:amidohydrolase family protein [Candidatus Eremiobacteraeota bacterium]
MVRAGTIVPCVCFGPQDNVSFEQLGAITKGAILVHAGKILALGGRATVERRLREVARNLTVRTLDFDDCIIVPGFVDAHTHPLYAGDREPDFAARSRSQQPALGMLHTVNETRRALRHIEEFWSTVHARLHLMVLHGTTTAEVKTGYALHKEGEIALLDLIDAHKNERDLPRLVATFLGAHALPPEYPNYDAFTDYLIAHVLPVASAHGAQYADAFCEPGYFSPQQAQRYLLAASQAGLRLRVHCDEMQFGSAAEMAARLDVDAIDHANYIRENDIDEITSRNIVVVACPATIAYLELPERAPVRKILQRGGTVALASDFNPGTSPCFNMQMVAYLGRALFGLSAAEALYAVTSAAARSLRSSAGKITENGDADFVALKLNSPHEFGWSFGGNLARAVVRGGEVVE